MKLFDLEAYLSRPIVYSNFNYDFHGFCLENDVVELTNTQLLLKAVNHFPHFSKHTIIKFLELNTKRTWENEYFRMAEKANEKINKEED